MISYLFKPFFKRFLGLFLSMVFVSSLSISLLVSFASTISNMKKTCKEYLAENQDLSAITKIEITDKDKLSNISNVEGVEKAEYRLTLDAFMHKDDGKNIAMRIFSYDENDGSIFNRFIIESSEKRNDIPNISIVRRFANNNNLKCGSTIKLGYFNTFIDLNVSEIIEVPEAIQPRTNEYILSDNTDFGFIYISEDEINKILYRLAVLLEEKINNDPAFKEYYDRAVNVAGVTFPDLVYIFSSVSEFTKHYTNQIMIKAKDGYTEEEALNNVRNFLETNRVNVIDAKKAHDLVYINFLERAISMFSVVTYFLPIFFYSVTMIVVGLFINQMIKAMTSQMGIMMSIGVQKMEIISLFLLFTFLMSTSASILGLGLGYGANSILIEKMSFVYALPTLKNKISPIIAVAGSFALLFFTELATIISCQAIFRITPKDATISNEAKRKKTPKWLENFLEKAPMNLKLAANSIHQNTKKFIVSTFSIFASLVMILLACLFYVSKTDMVDQTIDRRLTFDAQVYLNEVLYKSDIDAIRNEESVKTLEACYYTYIIAETADKSKSTYLECLAFDPNTTNDLISIPSRKGDGYTNIESTGIVIPKTAAKALGVNIGDNIYINDMAVRITDLSFEYFHPMAFLSKDQLSSVTNEYVTSLIVDLNNDKDFLEYISGKYVYSITVFTENLRKDLQENIGSIDIFIYLIIFFSLLMGLFILSIMTQNALMDQKRQLSVLRLIGFKIIDVSNLWTFESSLELLLSCIFAIPSGIFAAIILFNMVSSNIQTFPFVFSWYSILFSFLFVLLIVLISHLFAMFSISRWNLANNTRSRE